MRVLGVDLSLTATGFAWSDGDTRTFGRQGLTAPSLSLQQRAAGLESLALALLAIVCAEDLDLLVIENLPATGIAKISTEKAYVWWRFVHCAHVAELPVLEVSPKSAKLYATGRGDANKREVIAAVQQHFPDWDIHKTGAKGKPLTSLDDNKADAVTLMAIGAALLGHPVATLPAGHLAALDKLTLPATLEHHGQGQPAVRQ